MTQCEVQRCTNPVSTIHTLRERQGFGDYPMETPVCDAHKAALSNPNTEWMLDNDGGKRKLLVGESLQGLNEYVVRSVPDGPKVYFAGREFSHHTDDGQHYTFKVRRRGDKQESDITLVMDKEQVFELYDNLKAIVKLSGD